MRTSPTTWLVASLVVASAHGLTLHRRADGLPRVIGMATERRRTAKDEHTSGQLRLRSRPRRRHSRHQDRHPRRATTPVTATVAAALDNEETLYFVNATLGTPPQQMRLHLDTGSSDLWVNTAASTLCAQPARPCALAGTYEANASSTYAYVASDFNISYVDGSGASGDYVRDAVRIGTTGSTTQLQFGIGYRSSSAQGILGIGYASNEVQVARTGLPAYANLPVQLAADGHIKSASYSLWLNDLDAHAGSILFGGVDTSHFRPPLYSLPIQKESSAFSEFLITLTGLTYDDPSVPPSAPLATNLALAVLLDSGSSLTYLPDALVQHLYDAVGALYDSAQGVAYVPCSLARRSNATVTFHFSAPAAISVALNELVLDLVTAASAAQRPTLRNGQPACLFGIAPAGSGTNVLGDTFLRSAYVVYNLENNEISLAQTVFNTSAEDNQTADTTASTITSLSQSDTILEIVSGSNGVPGASPVANAVAATAGLSVFNAGASLSQPSSFVARSMAIAVICGLGFLL